MSEEAIGITPENKHFTNALARLGEYSQRAIQGGYDSDKKDPNAWKNSNEMIWVDHLFSSPMHPLSMWRQFYDMSNGARGLSLEEAKQLIDQVCTTVQSTFLTRLGKSSMEEVTDNHEKYLWSKAKQSMATHWYGYNKNLLDLQDWDPQMISRQDMSLLEIAKDATQRQELTGRKFKENLINEIEELQIQEVEHQSLRAVDNHSEGERFLNQVKQEYSAVSNFYQGEKDIREGLMRGTGHLGDVLIKYYQTISPRRQLSDNEITTMRSVLGFYFWAMRQWYPQMPILAYANDEMKEHRETFDTLIRVLKIEDLFKLEEEL